MIQNTFSIPLGTVVHDSDMRKWVYYGWRTTKVGTRSHKFTLAVLGKPYKNSFPNYMYEAVSDTTLMKKFPDLADQPGVTHERVLDVKASVPG